MLSLSAAAQGALVAPTGAITQAVDLPQAPQPTVARYAKASLSTDDAQQWALAVDPRTDLAQPQDQTGKPGSQAPQSPDQAPSLQDLGLSPTQTKPDPDLQARLDRRTHMLKVHQRLGLFTLVPLAAACISSAAAPPDPRNGSGNTVGRDIHLSLGATSVAMYGFTAYYAIRAPRVGNEPARGGIKLHKYLIYIHAPGMVLTPILGAMAFQQANDGERVHGIASAHAAVAWATVASYTAAIVAVSWPIHLKL